MKRYLPSLDVLVGYLKWGEWGFHLDSWSRLLTTTAQKSGPNCQVEVSAVYSIFEAAHDQISDLVNLHINTRALYVLHSEASISGTQFITLAEQSDLEQLAFSQCERAVLMRSETHA